MKSVKCPECGLVGADDELCKKCNSLRASHLVNDSQTSSPNHLQYQAGGQYSQGQLKKALAVTSLVIGIVSVFTFGLLGLGAIAGTTLAIVALVNAKRSPHEYGGRGLATAGLITSILSLVIMFPIGIALAIEIPDALASQRAANEEASIQTLRTIHKAEATYAFTIGKGAYGTLDQLAAAQLIDSELASGIRNGYKFTVAVSTGGHRESPGFQAVGVPLTYEGTGIRSFYVDENSIIRGGDSRGAGATALSTPLAN